jgi:hypothetical protein
MNKLPLFTLTALFLASGAASSAEQGGHRPRDPGVNARQHHQQHRVNEGIRSGELTGREARGLRQERNEIRREERAYKADGVLTREERKDLHQDLNEHSQDIYQQKHDDQQRPKAQ